MQIALRKNQLPQLVIFDLDGTLLDSSRATQLSFERAFRKTVPDARTIPLHELLNRQGIPFKEIVSEMKWPPILAETFKEESIRNISANRLYPGVKRVLVSLFHRGVRLGLCTGKDRTRTLLLLQEFGLEKLFQSIVCGDDPCPGKPAPDGLHKIIAETRSCTDDCVFVGDSPVDRQAAENAGVVFLAVRWPGQAVPPITDKTCSGIEGSDLVRHFSSGDFSCLTLC
jgi:HAD superfamily hydrolase (TIGR01549 family)